MTATLAHPIIIQGGMAIGVSHWRLARAVSACGQLGVVSGTALDNVLVRRLQNGDLGGHIRHAMETFRIREVGAAVLRRYFQPDGWPQGMPYKAIPMYKQVVSKARQHRTMLANFVEVHLAKESHAGRVRINLLTKVQMPNLASLSGAILAGVDYVLMGAGIPKEIPGVLDRLAAHEPASIWFDVEGLARDEAEFLGFDPREHRDRPPPEMVRDTRAAGAGRDSGAAIWRFRLAFTSSLSVYCVRRGRPGFCPKTDVDLTGEDRLGEKSLFAAAFAPALAAVALGCDSDPADTGPDPNPISIGGDYEYAFDLASGDSSDEIKCAGAGTITITQESDIRFSGKTAANGTLFCTHFGPFFSGVVDIPGAIIGTQIELEVPLADSGACVVMGTVEGNPVTRVSGDATCLVDPETLGLPGHLFELNGGWRAKRKDS